MDHRKEVYNMLYGDFDKQVMRWVGVEEGREQAHVEIATNLIREGLTSAERISSLVGMPLDEVVRLAGELGATLPLV